MKILLLNPNTTEALTDRMSEIAQDVAGSDAQIVPLTAPRGFPYIASRTEAQIAGAISYEMLAEHSHDADAAIIAAFGDPGLIGARESFDIPIVGMAEAAILHAAMLGERFSIVTFSPVMRRWYADCSRAVGLDGRFAGVRTPDEHFQDVGRAHLDLRSEIVKLACDAVKHDGADVIILGGAPLAGLSQDLQKDIPAPVVDPIAAATVQAISLAKLTSRQVLASRASKPIPKSSTGLSACLSDVLARGQAL
ncbi:aspartate/glutamate racemase family protein [Oceanibium sediminis]|uniref:aspartate/glutamate racemase family protein n=1 Tax=Oceanibium sediminis TaxID=2026339 RepID=UPI000DD452C8|nr:aspartate/glutamate racemase family protein [Oceanibium sediminis]